MTTVALLADPPRAGVVLSKLSETSPLSPAEAADLYAAMFADVVRCVGKSGGDLLVNYRPDDALPDAAADAGAGAGADADNEHGEAEHPDESRQSSETELRALVADVLGGVDEVRFEVQVGETFAGRAGNTATHLLEREGADSVAVVEPTAVFLTRSVVDGAAMKLRRSDVVLGPAPGGRVYFAAFADTIDFQGAYAPPAVETLAERAGAAGHDVDFLSMLPVVETGADLADALALLAARRAAGRSVPEHTVALLDDFGVGVEAADGGLSLVRDR